MTNQTTSGSPATPVALPLAYPLDDFYTQAGLALPVIEAVRGDEVPEPFRTLLVHQDDMTPTLEKFHGDTIHIRVLRRQQRDDFYFREVLLVTDKDGRPVEFGAIKINLALFPPAAKADILAERVPLGRILDERAVAHESRPKAFLRVQSDTFINSVLGLGGPHTLFGRRNTHWDPQQRPLAEIVEILPPALK